MKALYWLVVAGVALYAAEQYRRAAYHHAHADKLNDDIARLTENLRREPPADLRAWKSAQELIDGRRKSRDSWREDAESYTNRSYDAAAVAGAAALAGLVWEVLKRRRRKTGTPPDATVATSTL